MARQGKTYRKVCRHCGGGFVAHRSDKSYCSEQCSDRFHNAKTIFLSRHLTQDQKAKILEIQTEFLRSNNVK